MEQVLQDVSSARGAADAVLMAIHQEAKNGFLRRATEAKEELDGPKYGIGGQEVVAGKGSSKATA